MTVTIAVGCFLLLMNVFIFAAIYYQREKRATYTRKKEELTVVENSNLSSSPSIENYQQKGSRKSSLQSTLGVEFEEYNCYDEKLLFREELNALDPKLQKNKYTPPCGSRSVTPENFNKSSSFNHQATQDESRMFLPSYAPQVSASNIAVTCRSIAVSKTELCNQATQVNSPSRFYDNNKTVDDNDQGFSSENIPYPPPPPRSLLQSGILRPTSAPATPRITKKRVQIQEISV